LTGEHGWSFDECETWLATALAGLVQLLSPRDTPGDA
jgi:hypothetical protein